MRYCSTRNPALASTLSAAILAGAAPDGGLFIPSLMPRMLAAALDPDMALDAFAARLLAPFFKGDALASQLPGVCSEAFSFEAPLVTPDPAQPTLRALELFHGPTGAFKDFGARFLMSVFDRIADPAHPMTVLVATSGDTGGAVGCAAEGRAAVRAVILYADGRVSPFQEHQLTCWSASAHAFRVDGDFDACQRLVKQAFADAALTRRYRLTSANSINIARLLPQMSYIARAALQGFAETGVAPGVILPSGNLGHGVAALYARAIGIPIGPIILSTNANATLSDWAETGVFTRRASIATLANAMDVGAPSNFERLAALPDEDQAVEVVRVDDAAIRARIQADHKRSGYVWCPHSATAAEAFARLPEGRQRERLWIAAATAHPYKFADIVEPLIGHSIEPTAPLAAVLDRPARSSALAPDLSDLAQALAEAFEPSGALT